VTFSEKLDFTISKVQREQCSAVGGNPITVFILKAIRFKASGGSLTCE
jgi:hypothetical protein